MITLGDYFMGRDKQFPGELAEHLRDNAVATVEKANRLIAVSATHGVTPGVDQVTKTHVSSGWRPAAVNDRTANAAKGSLHMTCEAIDLQDHRDRRLAAWCIKNLGALEHIGLWMEDPRWTFGNNDPWVHIQTRPPKSGKRVFVPSSAPPQSPPLPGQV